LVDVDGPVVVDVDGSVAIEVVVAGAPVDGQASDNINIV